MDAARFCKSERVNSCGSGSDIENQTLHAGIRERLWGYRGKRTALTVYSLFIAVFGWRKACKFFENSIESGF
jgi:hypothetical protein